MIIGCGRLGAALAGVLCERKYTVTVIDSENASFDRLPPGFPGTIITGDAADVNTLVSAGIQKADIVMPVTGDDNTNLFAAQIAKDIYRTPKVIARLSDPERGGTYGVFGIRILSPYELVVRAFAGEVTA